MSIDRSLNIRIDKYDVKQIAEGIYKINEYNLTTMFVIVGSKRALAIDCGTGVGDYKAVIEGITKLPYDLAITHAHVDHIGGRGQFEKMYLSKTDSALIKDVTVSARKGYISVMKYLMMFKVVRWKDAKCERVQKEPEIEFIKEGDVFDLGGKTIKVFETPAHTQGSLSYLAVEDKILFSGDILNPNNLMFLKGASTIEEMRDSLIRVRNMDKYDTMWASHLSEPLSRETIDNGVKCAEKLSRRHNFLPLIFIGKHKDFSIIHLTSKYRKKKV
ncbi:MAG: MBL fold metallo-hydrolase, partial [Clostridia bacterium]|nr:MBL fold metallo-hydrolase [Clostridia bacterium]